MRTAAFLVVVVTVGSIGAFYLLYGPDPNSDEGRARNIEYMRDTLAPLVLAFEQSHGEVPESFSQAHDESGIVLPNRGDYYGRSMVYQKRGPNSFRFVSFGANGQYDDGEVDDVVVEFIDGKWQD